MYQCYQGHYDSCACGTFRPPSFSGDVLGYWERSFFQRMRSLYKFSGLPEAGQGQVGWDYDALLYQLLRMGYAVVFNTKTYGLCFFNIAITPQGSLLLETNHPEFRAMCMLGQVDFETIAALLKTRTYLDIDDK
jgi:hypothetical protein